MALVRVVDASSMYDTLKKRIPMFHRHHMQKVENVAKEGPRETLATKADYTMIDEPGKTFKDAVRSVLWFALIYESAVFKSLDH